MATLYVDQLLSRPAETVTPDTPVDEAAAALIEHDVGALVVVDDAGRLSGLVTATDLVMLLRDGVGSRPPSVGDVMRTDVLTTTRETPVSDVAAAMVEHLIHHVPVIEDDDVVGMITTLDLAAHLAR